MGRGVGCASVATYVDEHRTFVVELNSLLSRDLAKLPRSFDCFYKFKIAVYPYGNGISAMTGKTCMMTESVSSTYFRQTAYQRV